MAASVQKQLGQYLRQRRGEMTLPAFARKLGISSSSLHRMERGEQDVTLKTLKLLLKRLKCKTSDMFAEARNPFRNDVPVPVFFEQNFQRTD